MTKASKSVAAYSDIDKVYNHVLQRGVLTLAFPSKTERTKFIFRANAYRVLLRKLAAAKGDPEVSPYDHLMVCRSNDKETDVIIRPRGFTFLGATDENGNPVEFDKSTAPIPVLNPEDSDFLSSFKGLGED